MHAIAAGSPALEFALISPLLFMGVFGSFEFGRAHYQNNLIASATAIGARTATVASDGEAKTITDAILAKLSNIDADNLKIDFTELHFGEHEMTKISVEQQFDFLIKFGSYFPSLVLSSERYVQGSFSLDCDDPIYAQVKNILTVCLDVGLGGVIDYDVDVIIDDDIDVDVDLDVDLGLPL